MSRYLYALRFALSRQASAYGFTLIVWSTGALASWELGSPGPVDVFAFLGGALVAMSSAVAFAFGPWRPFKEQQPFRRPFSGMHVPSVPVAAAAGFGVTAAVGGAAGYFFASFVAVAVYEASLAGELALAVAPPPEGGPEEPPS